MPPSLATTFGLVVLYMAVEVVWEGLPGSLALLADAGHKKSHALVLALTPCCCQVCAPAGHTPTDVDGHHPARKFLPHSRNRVTLVAIAIVISSSKQSKR